MRDLTSYVTGLHAEKRAKTFLENLGYTILRERLKTPHGEIDILAMDNKVVVAVEVKYRKTVEIAHHSVLPKQCKRIADALQYYISQFDPSLNSAFQRFDVVLVCPGKNIIHYKNAWSQCV